MQSSVILVWLASPSDMAIACRLLEQAGLDFRACATIDALVAHSAEEVGALLIEDEGLTAQAMDKLNVFLNGQPAWSYLPVTLLVKRATGTGPVRIWSQWIRNLTVVDRPVTSPALVSVLRMALRSRERQCQVRDLLVNLQELNRSLELRVAERTVQLERTNKDLEQFAYVASHDLQEPLRMVTGFMSLLKEQYKPQLDEKAGQYIDLAADGANRMSQLIRDLLAYARAGRMAEGFQDTDVETLLGTAMGDLAPAIAESGAVVQHEPLPTVKAEREQLLQLLQNLIGNAIKYRPKDRRPVVNVKARREGQSWVFSVQDNGIGISEKDSESIFMMFQRLHTRSEYSGTGIGLAICKRIVEHHGGRIWVESTPGEGSTFFFTLADRP